MRLSRRHLLAVAGATALAPGLLHSTAWGARQTIDSAGREFPLPQSLTRIFPAGPPAAIFLYMLAPDLLAGWPRALYEDEAEFIAAEYRNLPVVGRLTGRGGTANLESVLAMMPDFILDYGSVRDTFISLANRVQEQTGIPYALVDGRFENVARSFRQVGTWIGRADRGEACAREVERIVDLLASARRTIPEEQRPRVYYARGTHGLQTGLDGSINVELLSHAGAVNVAADAGEGGLASVSMEQVLAWDPDVILTIERNFYQDVWDHPVWRTMRAVRAGRVYLSPDLPFGWFDRPPSANRLIGLHWLLSVLYPDRFGASLSDETRRFYAFFYHVELTDAQLGRLFRDGTAPGSRP